jgi:hypothetical protein
MLEQLEKSETRVTHPSYSPIALLAFGCLSIVLVLWAFSPALFSYCTSDDFMILSWLRQTRGDLSGILSQFTGPWLGLTEIKYYRPLPMLDWSIQYALWHENLLNYHIVNLLTYVATALLVFLVAFELAKECNGGTSSHWVYATLAASIFTTYPDHCEVVNWLVGRLDLLATFFLLASVWCHLRWRNSNRKFDLVLAYLSMALGFLSKENAILIPPLLVMIELFLGWSHTSRPGYQPSAGLNQKVNLLFHAIRTTLGYWAALVVYLLLRKAVIGDFLGGWGPTITFYSRPIHLELLNSLQHLLVPLNASVFSGQIIYFALWLILFGLAAAGLVLGAIKSAQRRYFLAFLSAWFVLALLPTYRFLLIDGDLLNSRLAFMATVPLSLAMALGFDYFLSTQSRRKFASVASFGFVILSSAILFGNNQPWRAAGIQVIQFAGALNSVYKKLPSDPSVRIIGVPLEKDGVYVCLNGLPGMTKRPFLMRDVNNCDMVDGRDSIFPVGYFKQQIAARTSPTIFFRWAPFASELQDVGPSGKALDGIEMLYPSQNPSTVAERAGNTWVLRNLNVNCWHTGFIKIAFDRTESDATDRSPKLYFKNDTVTEFDRFNVCLGACINQESSSEYIFPLSSMPNWAFGGTCRELKLVYKGKYALTVKQVMAVPDKDVAPQIRVVSGPACWPDGAIALDQAHPKLTIAFDGAHVPGCTRVQIEAMKATLIPTQPNAPVLNSKILQSPIGTVEVGRDFFPGPGAYKFRLRALNDVDKSLGYPSDHLLIHI